VQGLASLVCAKGARGACAGYPPLLFTLCLSLRTTRRLWSCVFGFCLWSCVSTSLVLCLWLLSVSARGVDASAPPLFFVSPSSCLSFLTAGVYHMPKLRARVARRRLEESKRQGRRDEEEGRGWRDEGRGTRTKARDKGGGRRTKVMRVVCGCW
jgi:hypothetical protein